VQFLMPTIFSIVSNHCNFRGPFFQTRLVLVFLIKRHYNLCFFINYWCHVFSGSKQWKVCSPSF
jgi:hypothetical protein